MEVTYCDVCHKNDQKLREAHDRFNITLRTSQTVTEKLDLCLEHWEKVRKALNLPPWKESKAED